QRERERTALAVFTLEADISSQQLRQFLAQLQAQSCALVAAQVTLHLAERLKQSGLIFWPDTYACIVYAELRPGFAATVLACQHNAHIATLSELDGFVDKIEQNLTHGTPICDNHHFPCYNVAVALNNFCLFSD